MQAVRGAEYRLATEQETKAYVGPAGNERFNQAVAALVLGAAHPALRDQRVQTVQAIGGSGALRLGAELIRLANASAAVHISDPTWVNHVPLLAGAGLQLGRYPYYDARAGVVQFDMIASALRTLPRGDVVLVHGSCHNPTGADLSPNHWHALADVLNERGLIPFVDLAYQGLGAGLDQDAEGARILARAVPAMLIAISCSKNFGLYRERAGALLLIAEKTRDVQAAASNVCKIARGSYSMPPDHGAAVVLRVLEDTSLAALWRQELAQMRERTVRLRSKLSEALAHACRGRDFSWVTSQHGFFSMLDLPRAAVDRLRAKHIYIAGDGRINVSGMRDESVGFVAWSIAAELGAR